MLRYIDIRRIFVSCSLALPIAVSTIQATVITIPNTTNANNNPTTPVNSNPGASGNPAEENPVANGNLQAAAIAAKTWLGVVDSGKYNESWDDAASLMKLTVSKEDWNRILTKTRKPLGEVKTRDVADQRTAFNPRGMPAGNYMVMVYKTSFANKPSAYELVTLAQEDEQWRVLTYQID